jgi:lysophospholipase L1-like esterase
MLKYLLSLLLFTTIFHAATISTTQDNYLNAQSIVVNVSDMSGAANDWIGIYPAGSDNSWGNVLSWRYTKGVKNGQITLPGVADGQYEARAFFNNSYTLEASYAFSVGEIVHTTTLNTSKETYSPQESITLNLSQMSGASNDWVAIYPAGSSNSWNNVLSWKYTHGIVNGTITLNGVPAGEYEARAFFRNSYHLEAKKSFSVSAVDVGSDNAKIFIIGDSTVHNTSYGEMGWGSKLGTYMKYSNHAYNRARSGSSSKSYKIESASKHDWIYTKSLIQQSDISNGAYLFIQFGHNDEKDGYLHTEPGRYNSYYNELKTYIEQARDLGVTPVLITPVSRQYKGSRTHGAYPQTMKDLAHDESVVLLDLEYKSYLEFNKYNSDSAIQNVFSYDDGTHFNPTGANIVAGWVKELACMSADATLCHQFQ